MNLVRSVTLGEWTHFLPGATYRCVLDVEREGDCNGYRYVAVCANLPGIVGEGDTDKEAVQDAVAAFRAVLPAYGQERIPWREPGDRSPDYCKRFSVSVEAPS